MDSIVTELQNIMYVLDIFHITSQAPHTKTFHAPRKISFPAGYMAKTTHPGRRSSCVKKVQANRLPRCTKSAEKKKIFSTCHSGSLNGLCVPLRSM